MAAQEAIEVTRAERVASWRGTRLEGLLWAALSIAIFSGWFVVTRFSVTRELQVWDVTALRFGVGAVLLAPAVLRRGSRLPMSAWGEGLCLHCWGAPFVLLVALGLKPTSAAQAASIAPTTMPLVAGILSFVFLKEQQGGSGGLDMPRSSPDWSASPEPSRQAPPSPAGVTALAAAGGMWAVYTLLFRRSGLSSIQAAALICIWSAALFLPAYVLFGLSHLGRASASEIALQLFYQGVLMGAVALVTFNRAVSLLGASAATAMIALVPAAASLLAIRPWAKRRRSSKALQ
jgi:drug/metabolite transporter (DMT)-like permease